MSNYDFLPGATYTVTGEQLNRLMQRQFKAGEHWMFASICEREGWSSDDFASEERSNHAAIAFEIEEIRSSGTIETEEAIEKEAAANA